jgi:hypothetical protein
MSLKIKKQIPDIKSSKSKKMDYTETNEHYEVDFDQQVSEY